MAQVVLNPTLDGFVSRESVDEAFSTIRTGSGTTAGTTDASKYLGLESDATTNHYDLLRRGGFVFDPTSIPGAATITAAKFSLVVVSGGVLDQLGGSNSMSLVNFSPASTGSFAASDYANVGTTKQATDVTLASMPSDGSTYTDWTLNATGLTSLVNAYNAASKLSLGLRITVDNDNGSPTWASVKDAGVSFFFTEQGGLVIPKLTVTYTPGTSGSPLMMMGV